MFPMEPSPKPLRSRKPLDPPAGAEHLVSRRDAAILLGVPSDFKVRQLEKEGRLHAIRGSMGSAWYVRADVLALRATMGRRLGLRPDGESGSGAAIPDEALLALLGRPKLECQMGQGPRPRTPLDLVLEAGVSMQRAEEIWGFWVRYGGSPAGEPNPPMTEAEPVASAAVPMAVAQAEPPERRGRSRVERALLIQKLRDPRPEERAFAFEALRELPVG